MKIKKEIIRIYKAIFFSLDGLRYLLRNQASFRIETILFFILIFVLYFLHITLSQKLILLGLYLFIMLVEALNSAIEITIDRISLEIHPLSKAAKDIGSFCVLLAVIINGFAWLSIFIPA